MTEDTSLTHTEQAMAYYAGDLSPEEKAAFEAHLAGCEECRKLLADARELLPTAEAMLAMSTFKPKHTIEEQVARFDAMVRQEQAQRARRWKLAGLALAAGVAVVMGIAVFLALQPSRPGQKLYAPTRPHRYLKTPLPPDAGR